MNEPIFEHDDYRVVLKDFVQRRRGHTRGFSLRNWSRELGLASPSMLTMVLKGSRHPGPELVSRFCRALELEASEESYFRDLIELEKSGEDGESRRRIRERIDRQRVRGKARRVSRAEFAAIAAWHVYAIRELVRTEGFREEVSWIATRLQFRVTEGQIRDAIKVLLKVGLLSRDASGRLQQAGGYTETTFDIPDEAVKRFHEQVLVNARETVRRHGVGERELCGSTIAIPARRIAEVKELVRRFHRDVVAIAGGEDSDAVYHLETAFFPVAAECGK